MNKSIVSTLLGALILTGVSCVSKPSQTKPAAEEKKQAETQSRHIPFTGDFTQITNMGSINIVYTTGPCEVRVEGPKSLVELVSAEVDCGILLLSVSSERNQDIQKYQTKRTDLTAYVSSPSLTMLAVCGSGSFISHEPIVTDDIHIGSLRDGSIIIDSLKCSNLKYEINGTSRDSIGYISCNEALFVSSASGRLNVNDIDVKGELVLDDNNNSEIICKGKTASLVINNQGRGLISFEGTCSEKDIHKGKDARVTVR